MPILLPGDDLASFEHFSTVGMFDDVGTDIDQEKPIH